MSIKAIQAIFECDGCACEFGVDIEVAATRPLRWSMLDIANDYLRGGGGWIKHRKGTEIGYCSYQRGRHLCPECTSIEDKLHLDGCHADGCSGCAEDDTPPRVETSIGEPVRAETVDRLGLRRVGESVQEYMLRTGMKSVQPMPMTPRTRW
jgi:hypothetical protein